MRGRRSSNTALSIVLVICAGGFASCGDDQPRGQAAYCQLVKDNEAELRRPAIATPDDASVAISLYRKIEAAAPLSVAAEWGVLVGGLETANTMDPADPDSVQAAADAARRTNPASVRVVQLTKELCGVDLSLAG
jgi:hypothetical protein